MRKPLLFLVAAVLLLCATAARAATVTLFERSFNVNGVVDESPAGLNAAGFDFDTGLGSLSLTFSPGAAGSYGVLAFFDHEIDEAVNTFFNEYGTAVGTPAAGQSWEIDEPGYSFGDIFSNLIAGELDDANGVPPAGPDDVSMALGWDFLLAADEYALITFTLAETAPGSTFYLRQTDPDSAANVYVSSSLTILGGTQPVPEPSMLLLLGAGLAGVLACRSRRLTGRP